MQIHLSGTKWCGAGNKARNFNDLGRFWRTDSCCRSHDKCQPEILPFRKKYGKFNFKPYAVKGCNCEYRFRYCLKKVKTATSRRVYSIYFKVLKPKCMLLRNEKVCVKRNWFRCVRHGYRKRVSAMTHIRA